MSRTEEVLPTATIPPKSRLVRVNDASSHMLDFLAVMTGERSSSILYRLLREELRKHQDEVAWTPAPPPFVIRQTYVESGCAVLLFNPHLPPSSILTGKEAVALADALTDAVEGRPIASFLLTTSERGDTIRLTRSGRHVALHINKYGYPMTYEVARDVAAALDSASVHATNNTVAPTIH